MKGKLMSDYISDISDDNAIITVDNEDIPVFNLDNDKYKELVEWVLSLKIPNVSISKNGKDYEYKKKDVQKLISIINDKKKELITD
jgi:Cys-tRNA synthase (O-phospho-L-seryl-tRNA:Cys-tRNA synthase)